MIKNERVALVSDLHIGKHQNSNRWHKISLDFAKFFRDNLRENNIKDIIICGDVNDDRNEISVNTLHVLNEMFTLWKEFNITILVGNHDSYYKNRPDVNSLSLFSGWSNIEIIDKVENHKIFGKKLSFCPWGGDVNNIDKCDYLFGHLEINGFKLSQMKVCTNGLDSVNILEKSDMVISGHFHLRENRKYRNGRILYLGSPYEQEWGDAGTDSRGFYLLDIKNGDYEFIENTISPRHKKIRMSEITSAGDVTKDIQKDIKGNFITLIVDQEFKDLEKLEDFIDSLHRYKPVSIKVDHILENRVGITDNGYDYNSVNIKESIEEFIKMTDYENKDGILKETIVLYEKCKDSED